MLLTISTTHKPATDLGYLLHKNPARAQAFDLTFGKAHVFYPEASEERSCSSGGQAGSPGIPRGSSLPGATSSTAEA